MKGIDGYAQIAQSAVPSATARDAARQFEAYMVGFLAQQMRQSLPEGPMNSGAMSMFAGLFDQEIGRRVSEGGGLGLGEQLEQMLATQGVQVTSNFGTRRDPIDGTHREHHGVDIAGDLGSPIRPAEAGVVRFAGERGGYGNCVEIEHPDGTRTRYAHCNELKVREGDHVDAATEIATVGSTGRSTGPHLHFEVRQEGRPVDPIAWLREKMIGQR